jgi:hypothetical protein
VRTDKAVWLSERSRTSQHVVDRVDIFGKSVHDTAKRLRMIVKWEENAADSTLRTVVSKKDIGPCITRLMASFEGVR